MFKIFNSCYQSVLQSIGLIHTPISSIYKMTIWQNAILLSLLGLISFKLCQFGKRRWYLVVLICLFLLSIKLKILIYFLDILISEFLKSLSIWITYPFLSRAVFFILIFYNSFLYIKHIYFLACMLEIFVSLFVYRGFLFVGGGPS